MAACPAEASQRCQGKPETLDGRFGPIRHESNQSRLVTGRLKYVLIIDCVQRVRFARVNRSVELKLLLMGDATNRVIQSMGTGKRSVDFLCSKVTKS